MNKALLIFSAIVQSLSKKKVLACVICLSALIAIYAQPVIKGKIADESGIGIPFSAIGLIEKNFGTITFEDGTFTLIALEQHQQDTLVISAVGYKKKRIPFPSLSALEFQTITLEEAITTLDEVVVTPHDQRYQQVGSKKMKSGLEFSVVTPRKGTTIAVLYDQQKEESVRIQEIRVGVGKVNMEFFDLRCRIFSVDERGLPGEDILDRSWIMRGTEKKGIIVYAFDEEFQLSGPFFIGFEWVISKEQFAKLESVRDKYPMDFFSQIVKENEGLKPVIKDSKEVRLFNSSNEIVRTIKLGKERRDFLKEREKVNMKVYFLMGNKGSKTLYGSYITGKWSEYRLRARVSLLISN